MNLLCAARASDEKKDLQNLATARHGEDLGHPGSDPFKVLGRLNDPNKGKTTSSDSTVGIASDNITDVRYLMGDTNTCRSQHDCAIRAEVLAAIWSFGVTCG